MKKKPKSERQFIARKHRQNGSGSSSFAGFRLFFMPACYQLTLFVK